MVPQPPYYWLLDSDGCWDCNCNQNGCGGCKRLKEQRDKERKAKQRIEKQKIKNLIF